MSVYRYFRRYVEYGVVPSKRAEDRTLVPENVPVQRNGKEKKVDIRY